MRISTRGKNAIKLMLDLATYNHGEPVRLKDIAKRQNISEKYLEQIVAVLHKAALVKSIRGAHGGYVLNQLPEKYTAGQILKAVEGDMSPTDCVGDHGTLCENKATCVSYRLWDKLDKAIKDVLEGITLADMLEWQKNMVFDFMEKIPQIRAYLDTDIQAAYEGDPAAGSKDEVILSYPGLYAVSVYRIAHELFLLGVPMIPRIMTEHAHSVTGIDIHPGAVIGRYFFMDHGTGIVIGETTVIGEHVKVYQGVTLGGLSTKGGQKLKGVKRHPTIKDHVTIYSGSSILGGDTVIEENVVVGGNTFITKSVGKDTRVSVKDQELQFKN